MTTLLRSECAEDVIMELKDQLRQAQQTIWQNNQDYANLESTLKRAQKAIDAKDHSNGNLRSSLRKAHQEAQQWEDETCLEIDELDSIIDGQQEYIKQITAERDAADAMANEIDNQLSRQQGTNAELMIERERLRSQLNAAYERNLKQGFTIDAVKQEAATEIAILKRIIDQDQDTVLAKEAEIIKRDREIADWKHSHSDACEMNRRLCQELQSSGTAQRKLIEESEAYRQEAADARKSNNSLLDQLQAAEAINKWYQNRFGSISQLEKLREKVDEKLRTSKPVDYRDLILTGIDTYKPRI